MNSKPNDNPLIDVGDYIVVRKFVDLFARQFHPAMVLDQEFNLVSTGHKSDRAAIDEALRLTWEDGKTEQALEHEQHERDTRRHAAGL